MPPFESKRVPRSYVKSHGGDAGSVGTVERGVFKPDPREAVQSLSIDTKRSFEKTKSNSQPLDFVNALAGVAPAVGAAMRPKPNMDYGQYIPFGLTFAQGQQLRDHQLSRVTAEEAARQNDEKLGLERQKMMGDEAARQQTMMLAEKDFGLRERSMDLQEREINARIANTEVMQRLAVAAENRNQERYELGEKPFMAATGQLNLDMMRAQINKSNKDLELSDAQINHMAVQADNMKAMVGFNYAQLSQRALEHGDQMALSRDQLRQQAEIANRNADIETAKVLFDNEANQRMYEAQSLAFKQKLWDGTADDKNINMSADMSTLAEWNKLVPQAAVKADDVDFSNEESVTRLMTEAAKKAGELGSEYAAKFFSMREANKSAYVVAKLFGNSDPKLTEQALNQVVINSNMVTGDKAIEEQYKAMNMPSFGTAINAMRNAATPIVDASVVSGNAGDVEGTYIAKAENMPKGFESFIGNRVIVENFFASPNAVFEKSKIYAAASPGKPFAIGRRDERGNIKLGGFGMSDPSGSGYWFFKAIGEVQDAESFKLEAQKYFTLVSATPGTAQRLTTAPVKNFNIFEK